MTGLKDFKQIADEAMADLTVTGSLRQKTLSNCVKKKRIVKAGRMLACAAVFALLLITADVSGLFKAKNEEKPPDNMMITTEAPEILAEPYMEQQTDWQVQSTDEARELFEGDLELPEFIPPGFEPESMFVSGRTEEEATKAIFLYTKDDREFILTAETAQALPELSEFEKADLNGILGYIKSLPEETGTDLYWIKNGVLYSISGSITRDDAVKIASSMR